MVTLGRIVGGTFVAGIFAGFSVLAATLYAYEKWAWGEVKEALTWAKP